MTKDDTPTQKAMRLSASHVRETLKEVFVDETCMRFGDKGMDLVVQWNGHLGWNAQRWLTCEGIWKEWHCVQSRHLIPKPHVRVIIVSYRTSRKILATDMKLLSERPEALRGDSKVHYVYMDFTSCDFAMHLRSRRFGEACAYAASLAFAILTDRDQPDQIHTLAHNVYNYMLARACRRQFEIVTMHKKVF